MVKKLTISGIIAAIYIVLCVAISPLSYGAIQIRFAEFLTVLPFYNRKYIPAVVLGTFIANLFSPLGLIDLAFGVGATVLVCWLISICKYRVLVPLIAAVITGVLVGIELNIAFGLPVAFSMLTVSVGELIAVGFGVILFTLAEKNQDMYHLLRNSLN